MTLEEKTNKWFVKNRNFNYDKEHKLFERPKQPLYNGANKANQERKKKVNVR